MPRQREFEPSEPTVVCGGLAGAEPFGTWGAGTEIEPAGNLTLDCPTPEASAVERRREHRLSTDEPASLQQLNPLSDQRLPIRVLDVSRNGLRLSIPVELQRGTLVQIYLKGIIALGEIRHCTRTGAGDFCAGLQLADTLPCRSDDEPWEQAYRRRATSLAAHHHLVA